MITELTNLLTQAPKKAAYVTVSRRLLARIDKQMRAMSKQIEDMAVSAPLVELSEDDLLAIFADKGLTKTEFLLFRALVQRQGQVVSPEALVAAAHVKTECSLRVHIPRLHSKVKDAYTIETWRKNGYRLQKKGDNS